MLYNLRLAFAVNEESSQAPVTRHLSGQCIFNLGSYDAVSQLRLVASTNSPLVVLCSDVAVSSSRRARLEPKCCSKTYLSMSLCHLSADAVVMCGCLSQRGAQFQNVTEETIARKFTAAIISDCERILWKTPPRRGDLLFDFLSLNCFNQTLVSLSGSKNRQTSSEAFALWRLLIFSYHSTPVSNICHRVNPCRGIFLLLNCTVS